MKDEQIKELNRLITFYAEANGLTREHLLAFMSWTFVGSMVMNGYDKDFARATFERMFVNFKEMKGKFKAGEFESGEYK